MIYSGIFAQEEGMRLPLKPQNEYPGHLERIEAIEPVKDVLAAIQATEAPASNPNRSKAAGDDLGETGNEIGDILPTSTPSTSTSVITPKPTITQETDREGQVIPRATPVYE
jgi:hypothetical protein